MNVHGALNHGVWRVGVHQVEDRMNYLIAVDPRGAPFSSAFNRSASRISRHFVADAHCDDGKRFVGAADEILTAFLELDEAVRSRSDRA